MSREYLVYRYSVYPSARCHVGATRVKRGADWRDALPTGMKSGAVLVDAPNARTAIKKSRVRC